jgi:glycosyltransferase involved in cell wall biosynthesis
MIKNLSKYKVKNIAVITPNYPMKCFPESGTFVEQIVREWQYLGVITDVVAPISFPNLIRSLIRNKHRININIAGNRIVRPLHMSFGNKKLGRFDLDLDIVSRKQFIKAALKGVESIAIPDIYYGKFLLRGGIAALWAGRMNNRPVFADMGESKFLENIDNKSKSIARKVLSSLHGIVCVSERLRDEVVQLGTDPQKILVIPNKADPNRFKPMNKADCRQKLGLPENAFIVAFTGHFIERKGPLRVLKAIELIEHENVLGIFFGQGPQKPLGKKVLHAAPVPNKDLALWLNAADVFALPTMAEGSCNAINEALFCGLPVISSNIPDIQQQVPTGKAILINPLDIQAIADAILKIKSNPQDIKKTSCQVYGNEQNNAMHTGQRAIVIYEWITSRL